MASLAKKLHTLRNTLEVFGPLTASRATLAEMLSPRFDDQRFDRQFGTDTSGRLSVLASQLPPELREDARSYEPTPQAVMHHLLRRLPIRYEDFVFIDAGCGKGRAMLLASLYPFARIVGIELSSITSRVAQRNVDAFAQHAGPRQKCTSIEVLCRNVLEYRMPDANLVVFLYNPFQGAVFQAFMDRIHHFSSRHPEREVIIAYCNPWSGEEWLQRSGRFRKIHEHCVVPRNQSWILWRPLPSAAAPPLAERRVRAAQGGRATPMDFSSGNDPRY